MAPFKLGSKLSNKPFCASFGVRLPPQTVQKPQVSIYRAKSSEGEIEGQFGQSINSNFCENLGHKNTLQNVSNPCPKVGFWLTFASISSHVKLLGGECATRMLPPLDTRLPTCHLPYQQTVKGRKNSALATVKLTN